MASKEDKGKVPVSDWNELRWSQLLDELHYRNRNVELLGNEFGIAPRTIKRFLQVVRLVKTVDHLRSGLPLQAAREKAEEYIYGPVPEPETHITFEYEPRRPGGAVC